MFVYRCVCCVHVCTRICIRHFATKGKKCLYNVNPFPSPSLKYFSEIFVSEKSLKPLNMKGKYPSERWNRKLWSAVNDSVGTYIAGLSSSPTAENKASGLCFDGGCAELWIGTWHFQAPWWKYIEGPVGTIRLLVGGTVTKDQISNFTTLQRPDS